MIRIDVLAHYLERDGYKYEVIDEVIESMKLAREFKVIREELNGKC